MCSFMKSGWVMMLAGAMLAAAEELPPVEPAWLAPSLGPLSPSVHFNGAVGSSSGEVEELAAGHHDPMREEGGVQGLELGMSLRQKKLEGFATYSIYYGAEEFWDGEWEEAFLKLRDLPGGFELRGGRMLGRFGPLNATHLHAWSFVDMPLPMGRFLGEHGLWLEGGDVTWLHQGLAETYGITLGYGKAVVVDHEHGAEENEDLGDHEDEHAHAHGGLGFDDDVFNARVFGQFRQDDFHQVEAGASLATGDEAEGRRVTVYGLDITYTWRENGLEPGGRSLVLSTELYYRDVAGDSSVAHTEEEHEHDHADEHDVDDADHDHEEDAEHDHEEELAGGGEFGFYSDVTYTFNSRFDLGTRFSYVEGQDALDTQERFRISPAVTAYLDPYRRSTLRVQYNYDDLAQGEEEHTVWVQLGLHWGGAEVR